MIRNAPGSVDRSSIEYQLANSFRSADLDEEVFTDALDEHKTIAMTGSVGLFRYQQFPEDNYDYKSTKMYIQRLTPQVVNAMKTSYFETTGLDTSTLAIYPVLTVAYYHPEESEHQIIRLTLPTMKTNYVVDPEDPSVFDDEIREDLMSIALQLEDRAIDFEAFKSSGFLFHHIVKFELNVAVYDNAMNRPNYISRRIRSGGLEVTIPAELDSDSKTLYNPSNRDGNCGYKAIQSKVRKLENGKALLKLLKANSTPYMTVEQIRALELVLEVPINIFTYNPRLNRCKDESKKTRVKSNLLTLYSASKLDVECDDVINLLLLEANRDKDDRKGTKATIAVGHYCRIKQLLKLDKSKKPLCDFCFTKFANKADKDAHSTSKCWLVHGKSKIKTVMVKTEESAMISYAKIEAKQYLKGRKHVKGVVYYADFEAITRKNGASRSSTSSVIVEQDHVPCGVCILRVSEVPGIHNKVFYHRSGTGKEGVIPYFWRIMKKEETDMDRWINDYHVKQEAIVQELRKVPAIKVLESVDADIISIIKGYLSCHYKNEYPVLFHNLRGYDSHPLLKTIGEHRALSRISVIAQTSEKYLSFTSGRLKFLDSMSFLNFSLEKMVSNNAEQSLSTYYKASSTIEQKRQAMVNLRQLFANTIRVITTYLVELLNNPSVKLSDEHFLLIIQKGIYPYDYMDSFERFDDTKLPDIKEFKSSLTGRDIGVKEYARAQLVWSEFKIANMGEYHDLYNVQDVGLLADCFESFRGFMRGMHGLDPVENYTSPGFSWDAMLRTTGTEFHCFTQSQQDMHEWIESGTRGGVSIVPGRELIANNKYLSDYDAKIEDSFLLYVDATNLYGWAMTQLLPVGNYQWILSESGIVRALKKVMARNYGNYNDKYCDGFDGKESKEDPILEPLRSNYPTGYIFEIDAHVPPELHDKFWDYPLCPRKSTVSDSKLSPFSNTRLSDMKATNSKSEKLLLTLEPLHNYVIHERNLQLFVQLGLKVDKIHRVMSFDQEPAMRKYILKNSRERSLQKNDFICELLKLLNNAIFGKTMENKRKRIKHTLTKNVKEFQEAIRDPSMKNWKLYSQNTIGVNFQTKEVVLDKPIAVGFCILELSKCLMYNFYYNVLKRRYPIHGQLHLGFSDTDSLLVKVNTKDLWDDISKCDYLQDSLYTAKMPNKNPAYRYSDKIPGKMGVQNPWCQITHFKGLQAKFYAYTMAMCPLLTEDEKLKPDYLKTSNNLVKMCGKGVSSSWMNLNGNFEQYLEDKPIKIEQRRIGHLDHKISTTKYEKMAFNPIDNKFYQINAQETIPYGHYRIALSVKALKKGKRKLAAKVLDRDYCGKKIKLS
jgi:hypothetical protein